MATIERNSQALRFGRAIGVSIGLTALVATAGCGAGDLSAASPQPGAFAAAPQPAGAPVMVSCEPNQRTLVRPVVVNGATMSQVECITSPQVPAATQALALQSPSQPAPSYRPVRVTQPVNEDLGDTKVVAAPQPAAEPARVVRTRQPVYDDARPVKSTRSVKKSAVIIGSSAGVGAGVGAAVGGKKGALIGAAIGGGGAAIWDQITRRDK
jgi:hypothetical protein